MVDYAIIADDLSGSNDTAVTFSNFGFKSFVINFPEGKDHDLKNCDVVAISTNSREIPPHQAREIVVEVCRYLKKLPGAEIYKKIDSTCRGHIGIELEAIMEEMGLTLSIICPAFPKMGRVVKNGELLINGVKISRTAIASDPAFPVTQSYLPGILKTQTRLPVEFIGHETVAGGPAALTEQLARLAEKGKSFVILDAIDDSDLNTIASIDRKQLPPLLFCGSAALATALVKSRFLSSLPGIPPVYVVVGSVNPQNKTMTDFLLSNELAGEVYLDPAVLIERSEGDVLPPEAIEALQREGDLVIRAYRDSGDREKVKEKVMEKGISEPDAAEAIARGLSVALKEAVGRRGLSGLIVTGGTTALHILRGFQGVGIEVEEELEPGVPAGKIVGGSLDGVGIITKAGGFGSEHTFANGIQFLKKRHTQRRKPE